MNNMYNLIVGHYRTWGWDKGKGEGRTTVEQCILSTVAPIPFSKTNNKLDISYMGFLPCAESILVRLEDNQDLSSPEYRALVRKYMRKHRRLCSKAKRLGVSAVSSGP